MAFCFLDGRLLHQVFNYSCWRPHSPQLWKLGHTRTHTCVHTHIELCKCMCHVLLAVLFLGLCFVKGNWQLQYRVQYTSERLLLEMKAKGFRFLLTVWTNFLWDFRPALTLSEFQSFLTLLFSSLLFICLCSITPIKQCISFVFHAFHLPLFLIHLFFSSSVHFTSMFCSFFIHLLFLCNPFISMLSPSPSVCSSMSLPFHSSLTHVVILSQCCDSVSGRVR